MLRCRLRLEWGKYRARLGRVIANYLLIKDIDRNRYGQQYFFADNEAGNDPEDDYPLEDATDEA